MPASAKGVRPTKQGVMPGGRGPLRSSVPGGSFATSPRGNINRQVAMEELLANKQLVPGMRGADLKVRPGEVIRFGDLSQLTVNHHGAEFILSREVVRNGTQVTRRWRVYSGTPDEVLPPRFYDPNAPGGMTRIERVVGHTHPRPVPYDPIYRHPSRHDIRNLTDIFGNWQRVHGPQSEPFGRIIWGLKPGETTIYGVRSRPGNAISPSWLRR